MPRYQADPEIPTLREALTRHRTVEVLRKLIALLPIPAPTRKADLVDAIVDYLSGDGLREVYERMDPLQRAAVAEVAHAPETQFDAERFDAKYGDEPEWGGPRGWSFSEQRPYTLLDLVFHDQQRMPLDLKQRFRAFVAAPAEPEAEPEAELPEFAEIEYEDYDYATRRTTVAVEKVPLEVREMEQTALHDLEAVLRLVEDGKLAVGEKTQAPSAATIRAVAEVLEGGDFYDPEPPKGHLRSEVPGPIRAFAWPMLLQVGGLAKPFGKRLSLTPAGKKALTRGRPEEALRTLWQRWLKSTLLDELSRVEAIRGQSGRGKRAMTAVAPRRAAIVGGLTEIPPGKWIAVDEVFRYLRAAGHRFEVTRDPWTLYILDPNYGSLGHSGYHDWHLLQGRYALCFLFEYAATLGLIDVAFVEPGGARPDYTDLWGGDDLEFFSRYDGLMYLRITPLGTWYLGQSESYAPRRPAAAPRLTVLPTQEVIATRDLPPADALMLKRYAEETSPRSWRLTRVTLLAALEEGHTVETLREFLAARSTTAFPATVERLLGDAAERSRLLTDRGGARLIECATAELAALIANDARTRSLCLLAGERILAVPAEKENEFRRAVRKLGYPLPQAPHG